MRIVHVTDCYLPRLGGIEMHVHDLAERQRHAGHDARVLTSEAAAYDGPPDPPWVTRVRTDAPATSLRSLLAAGGLADELRALDPDVVHTHVSVLSPVATASAWQATRLGIPAVVTAHSLWSSLGVLPPLAGAALGLDQWPVMWSAVSTRAAESLRGLVGRRVPVRVLPNAVDPADWAIDRAAGLDPLGVTTIVSVMRLVRRKRPLALARMLRQVRAALPADVPLRAVIIGDGPLRAPLERYLTRHRMSSWVELPGRLERGEIREAFAAGSVYVAPALLESFGIAALEARCAGLPVVASARGGVGDFVTPGLDGHLPADDAGMVRDLVRLVADPDHLARLTEHTRRVVPDLGWDAAVAQSLEAYHQAARILEAGAGRRPRPRRLPGGAPA